MVELAEKARRNGLLALEEDVAKIDDAYTRKGLQLVVDGTDSDLVRSILESEIDGMAQRHHQSASNFAAAGGFAPTLGILGTVLGLVHVLAHLSTSRSRSARDRRRVPRHALRRRQREHHLPADRATS